MSIRLYPCTDNTANLAMLIDVPQGLLLIALTTSRKFVPVKNTLTGMMNTMNASVMMKNFRKLITSEFLVEGIFDYPTDSEYGDTFKPDLLQGCLTQQPRKICLNTYLLIKSFNYLSGLR